MARYPAGHFLLREITPMPSRRGRFLLEETMIIGTLLTSFALFAMLLTMDTASNHSEKRAVRSATILLNADIAKVFPLFGPLEEKKWSRGWDPQIVAAGATLQNTVFTYSHDGLTATWIVTEWDETRHTVTYAVFVPNDRAMTIRIVCAAEADKTRAQVTYMFTALNEDGTNPLREFEAQDFGRRILHWQHAINYYLETGKQWEGDSH
jgi:Polyketide cyclase / dehydrase and lipid transport